MQIRTTCNNCIFKLDLGGCELGKEVYTKENRQYTNGMCGHRREQKWIDRLLDNDPNFDVGDAFQYAQGEHLTLSVLITSLDVEMDRITTTLESIPEDPTIVRQIIVVTQNATLDEEKAILDRLYKKASTVWTLDNIRREDEISVLSAMNYASRLVRNLWFLTLEAGDEIGLIGLKQFYDYILPVENNYIGFYFDDNDDTRIIAHTGAFQIMEGHAEQPWLQKVKEFSNWQKVCKRIN